MKVFSLARIRAIFFVFASAGLLAPSAFAGSVTITSPSSTSSVPGAVTISGTASESVPFHLELWDNGGKLGDFFSNSVNISRSMSQGQHTLTLLAVSNNGQVLDQTSRQFNVAQSSPAATNGVTISSPTPASSSISAVRIIASAAQSKPFHLEIWDNGYKLGDVPAGNVNDVYVLPDGSHVLTVSAIDNSNGAVLGTSSVNYSVAENCSNSRNQQCNLDQLAMNNVQNDCNPQQQIAWVANGCGPGIQGVNPVNPSQTGLQQINDGSAPPNQGNLTLNGHSARFSEIQGSNPSNVLFRGQTPTPAPSNAIDSHWTLDEYVHLPDPNAHQAFEIDAQYSAGGIWTKFYTECAFNMSNGTGYWAVFDTATGGWIFLNGTNQNGQDTPAVPCNRSQFYQPWSGSSNPSFTGWHHIAWSFLRNPDGTVTYQSLTFDGTTTQINFRPNSNNGGNVSDNGNFSALIQLDGAVNYNGKYNVVDAYVSELNITHNP